jgi:hypothetical protein
MKILSEHVPCAKICALIKENTTIVFKLNERVEKGITCRKFGK